MQKRVKHNWLEEIKDANLSKDFEDFCADNDLKQHIKGKKVLSRKRLAYAYMVHVGSIIRHVNLWR